MSDFPSLLSREESTSLKGVLILLVILGHNAVLMENTGLFPYIYSFHVYCFYILPFAYGLKSQKDVSFTRYLLKQLWKDVSFYYPLYILWSLVSLVITQALRHPSLEPAKVLCALLFGNGQLREYCGSAYLWFLPTIVAVLFWKNIYFLLPKMGKAVLFGVTVVLWLLAILGVLDYRTPGNFIPFSIYSGLAFCFSGILARCFLEHMQNAPWKALLFFPIFAIVPIFIRFRPYLPNGYTYLSWSLMPVIAFVALVQLRECFSQSKILLFLGSHSLGLYLVHVFIYNGLSRIIKQNSLCIGILLFILTLGISIVVILAIERTPLKVAITGFNKHSHNYSCPENRKS